MVLDALGFFWCGLLNLVQQRLLGAHGVQIRLACQACYTIVQVNKAMEAAF